MAGASLPIGCFIRIEKPGLQAIIDRLKELGYRVIGPTISESAIVYDEIASLEELPIGFSDDQEAGRYRLKGDNGGAYFDYVVGPHSLKNYLFPPRATVLECRRTGTTGRSGCRRCPPNRSPSSGCGPATCTRWRCRTGSSSTIGSSTPITRRGARACSSWGSTAAGPRRRASARRWTPARR